MESRDSISDVWGPRAPHRGEWHPRVDVRTVEEPDRWVQSACIYCSTGCGIDIGVKDGRIVGVRGREVDRVNRGRLGPKGLNGWEANASPDRLTRPLIRRDGRLEEASWDEAMDLLIRRSRDLIAKAGLRTPHTDANTRLCTATAASALMESFGTDGQPASYRDIDVTDAL